MSTKEVASDVGLTERQLQWWDEQNILSAERVNGNRREYSEEDVRFLRVLAEMRRQGISLQHIRMWSDCLRKEIGRDCWAYIIVRGDEICLAMNAQSAMNNLIEMQRKSRGYTCVLKLQPRP